MESSADGLWAPRHAHTNQEGSMKEEVREHVTSMVDTDLLSHKVLNVKAGYCMSRTISQTGNSYYRPCDS